MDGSSYFQLLNPLIMMLFAGGFASIYAMDRRLRSAFWFAWAYGVGAIGFLFDFALRDAAGPYLGSYISNVPFMLALTLVVIGVHERCGGRHPWFAAFAICVLTFVAVTVCVVIEPHSFTRAFAMNFGSGFMYALAIVPLWGRWRRDELKGVESALFWVLTLNVFQSFVRPVAVGAVVGLHQPAVTYSDSLYALTLHLVSGIFAISLAATLIFALGTDLVTMLHRRASEDPLTGLLNRRGLEEAAENVLADGERYGLPVSIVIADIDHFKRVNDNWGHAVGDAVIKATADVLTQCCGKVGRIARFGGEEFVILLPHTDAARAKMLAEAVREAIATTPMAALPEEEHCTISLGVAERQGGETFSELVRRADTALYRAKRDGRDRVCADEASDRSERLRAIA